MHKAEKYLVKFWILKIANGLSKNFNFLVLFYFWWAVKLIKTTYFTKKFLLLASLAGSHSPCDPIYSNFLAFYPKFTSLAESNFEIFSSNASQYPIWTNGLLTSFGCKVFSSQIFLVNVISRWSGLSAKEIGSSILNYPKNPLPLPLSCIEDGIASIKQILTTQIVESEKIANKTRQLSTCEGMKNICVNFS